MLQIDLPPEVTAIVVAGMVATAALGIVKLLGVVLPLVRKAAAWVLRDELAAIVAELEPNDGHSLKDQVSRIETTVQGLETTMSTHIRSAAKARDNAEQERADLRDRHDWLVSRLLLPRQKTGGSSRERGQQTNEDDEGR